MESLSSVGTIVRIAQDIASAVATVSQNRSRCQKLAKRVQGIGDLLRELDAAEAGMKTDAATRSLLSRLQEAVGRELQLVRSCKNSSCTRSLFSGGKMADRFDEVDGEIDRCLLDLGVANRILIADLKRLLHQNVVRHHEPAGTETVTLRIGMPCDDRAEDIKRCICTMQGVTEVAVAASSKDKFMVTVRSGADIPSLLDHVKQKLNRNVELVKPAAGAKDATGAGAKKSHGNETYKKANNNSAAAEDRGDKQRHSSRYAGGDEIEQGKAPASMVGMNQQAPAPYVYLPYAVALVPVGDASNMYHALSPHGFVPYPQAPPGSHPVYVQRQSNPHRVHFRDTSVNGCAMKDADKYEKKGNVPGGSGMDKMANPVPKGGSEWKDGDKTAASGNVAAIGVPVHTVTARVHEVIPPPSYGYGYWPYARGSGTGDCCHHNTGGPSEAAAACNYNHYSSPPSIFSDENPDAICSVM